MLTCNIINNIHDMGMWIINNHEILLGYVIHITLAIFIIILGVFLSKVISQTFNSVLSAQKIDTTILDFLTILVRYLIITLSAIAALNRMGVQNTSVIAILGTIGVAIGLALQGSLSNFAAGMVLIMFRPLKVGEYIESKDASGTVLTVHVFYTTLKTLDGKTVAIPNAKIATNNIINYSRTTQRRNEFMIHVANNENAELVIKILKNVIYNEPRVLKTQDIVVGLNKLEPYSMSFIARCWSNSNLVNKVYWDLMLKFKKELDDNNITLSPHKIEVFVNAKNKKQKNSDAYY